MSGIFSVFTLISSGILETVVLSTAPSGHEVYDSSKRQKRVGVYKTAPCCLLLWDFGRFNSRYESRVGTSVPLRVLVSTCEPQTSSTSSPDWSSIHRWSTRPSESTEKPASKVSDLQHNRPPPCSGRPPPPLHPRPHDDPGSVGAAPKTETETTGGDK